MKITIDLEPGDLISVHYDDKMPPHVALNTLMTTTVNVFAHCLRKNMTHEEISTLSHKFGKAMESAALALYKLEQDGVPGGFSGKEAARAAAQAALQYGWLHPLADPRSYNERGELLHNAYTRKRQHSPQKGPAERTGAPGGPGGTVSLAVSETPPDSPAGGAGRDL